MPFREHDRPCYPSFVTFLTRWRSPSRCSWSRHSSRTGCAGAAPRSSPSRRRASSLRLRRRPGGAPGSRTALSSRRARRRWCCSPCSARRRSSAARVCRFSARGALGGDGHRRGRLDEHARAPVRRPLAVRAARDGARELLASAREGDAVAVVLAGTPARVALAATTDLDAARRRHRRPRRERSGDRPRRRTVARARASSRPFRRSTGASWCSATWPTVNPTARPRRGRPRARLGRPARASRAIPDCAVTRADRSGARVRVRVACGPGASAAGRELVVEDANGKVLGPRAAARRVRTPRPPSCFPADDAAPVRARLSGATLSPSDDVAPVLPETGRGAVAVIADATDEAVATGGAPIVEQALSALKLDVDVRPMPAFPDRAEDLAGTIGVLLDDPPGLTPEQRHALGGVPRRRRRGLLALGPHARRAPGRVPRAAARARRRVGRDERARSRPRERHRRAGRVGAEPHRLSTTRRATLAPEDVGDWSRSFDGSTGRRSSRAARWAAARRGWSPCRSPSTRATSRCGRRSSRCSTRGRPRHASAPRPSAATWARRGSSPARTTSLSRARRRRLRRGATTASPRRAAARRRLPHHRGRQDRDERRGAGRARARPAPAAAGGSAAGEGMGEQRASVDVSGPIALVILALVAAEMALRTWSRRKMEAV